MRKELQRHGALQPLVARPVHDPHAAGAELFLDRVVRDRLSHEWRAERISRFREVKLIGKAFRLGNVTVYIEVHNLAEAIRHVHGVDRDDIRPDAVLRDAGRQSFVIETNHISAGDSPNAGRRSG